MKTNLTHRTLFLVGTFVVLACNSPTQQQAITHSKTSHEEDLIRANKYLVNKDADIIKGYVQRRNWQMIVTNTGLWYMISQNGTGEKAQKGKNATLNYTTSLLDGTICYSSSETGPKTFRLGQGGVESGLEEGLLLLRVGDKARFILPPHLAYGLVGDQNKIPPRTIILYDVELIKLAK